MNLDQLSKVELIKLLNSFMQGTDATATGHVNDGILHELQTHQVELELQNRELRELRIQLEESRDSYAKLYEFAPVGYLTLDDTGKILEVNLTAATLLGIERLRLINKPFVTLLNRGESKPFFSHLKQSLDSELPISTRLRIKKTNGQVMVVRVESVAMHNTEHVSKCLTAFSDISKEVDADYLARKLATSILENTPEGVMITDAQQRIVDVNRAFTTTTGYTRDEAIGKTSSLLDSGRHDDAFYQELSQTLNAEGRWQGEVWNRRKNGEIYPEWLNITAIQDETGTVINYAGIFSDLSSQQQVRKRLHRLAYYDALTELPNRELFYDRLINSIANAKREGNQLALLFLDLDRFKIINDTLGHTVGDSLLKAVSAMLKQCVRESDTVARLGGDEFTIILNAISNPEGVVKVVSSIFDDLKKPLLLDLNELFVCASIGISIYPDDGDNPNTLLKHADIAMYQAKRSSQKGFQFFEKKMGETINQRLSLVNELRHALKNNALQLAYQPKIDLTNGRFIGMEALLRWQLPDMQWVSPTLLISVAEESGLMLSLGEWVLHQAFTQAAVWVDNGHRNFRMAINLSGLQISRGHLVAQVRELLRQTGLDPHYLEFELTETILMENEKSIIHTLRSLQEMGIHFSVDDFGTGYSSLAYLQRFAINRLKIDRSFIADVMSNKNDAEIVANIINLGHSLNLKVIAEGVENQAQLDYLQQRSCDEVQGFFTGPPVFADQMTQIMSTDRLSDFA